MNEPANIPINYRATASLSDQLCEAISILSKDCVRIWRKLNYYCDSHSIFTDQAAIIAASVMHFTQTEAALRMANGQSIVNSSDTAAPTLARSRPGRSLLVTNSPRWIPLQQKCTEAPSLARLTKRVSVWDSPQGCPAGVRSLAPAKLRITMAVFCSCKTGTSGIPAGRPTVIDRLRRLLCSKKKSPHSKSTGIFLI